MSISPESYSRQKKTAFVYLGVTVFCLMLGAVYEHFSHGVYSGYMAYMFLFPLIGGLVPFALSVMKRFTLNFGRTARNLYHAGLASLTVGSCIRGVLDIYGTDSQLEPLYWYVGFALVAAGFIFGIISISVHRD